MAKIRGPAAVTIITPSLSEATLKTLITNFTTFSTTGFSVTVANCTSLTTSTTITTTTANGFANVSPGMKVTGTGIPTDTFVNEVLSSTSISLTKTPTSATAGTLSLTVASRRVSKFLASDQLDAASLKIEEKYQANVTQASESPFGKTKTGLDAMMTLSIADDKLEFVGLATNANNYSNSLITMGDGTGLTTGTDELPYNTVIIQPYSGGGATTDPKEWYIMPYGGIESSVDLSFSLQTQRSFTLTITAYDPYEKGYRIMRGDPSLLP